MPWEKRGRLFEPDGQFEWIRSHASVPSALQIEGDRYRVYFGSRNERNETQPGYADVEVRDGEMDLLEVSAAPVLETSDLGRYDSRGIWPSWFLERDGQVYMYYNGWVRGDVVPYYSTIGLAISEDGGETFERCGRAPLMGRSEVDPYILGGPCVVVEDGTWRMWYLSGVDFRVEDDGPMYYYHIKYAESDDGLDWRRTGEVCIDHEHEGETRIARPCVRRVHGGYQMWYAYAIGHGGYRIGYAESDDGLEWERMDQRAGIEVSEVGWDSEMVTYPHVFEHTGETYLLYNGNGYGESGFGYAVLAA